jgi:hypothetical protein
MFYDVVTRCVRVLRICVRVLRDVTVLAEVSSADDLQSVSSTFVPSSPVGFPTKLQFRSLVLLDSTSSS